MGTRKYVGQQAKGVRRDTVLLKPVNIYLDIDGVLLLDEKHAALHADEFLRYILNTYPDTTYWLTTHYWQNINRTAMVLAPAFDVDILDKIKVIKPTEWRFEKTDAIDFSQPFLWFDDDLYPKEREVLIQNNALSSWVEVNLQKDPDQLQKLITSFPIPPNPNHKSFSPWRFPRLWRFLKNVMSKLPVERST